MSTLTDVGNLMYLYVDEIEPGEGTDAPEFLINATAKLLNQKEERNWIPVIVKETGKDQYEVIGNAFVYAVAKAAELERVWCIIAEATDSALEVTKALSREIVPQVNLSSATRDEIAAALKFLVDQPGSPLKGIKLAVAINNIEEDPGRKYWKSFTPITKLSCGITAGKKLDALKQVFYLAPEKYPDMPKVNLSAATRDEIEAALKYLLDQPDSPLKGLKLAVAINQIEGDPCRKYWKTLSPITKLKCGITAGKKLDALKQVFDLAPEPYPDVITEPAILETFTATELKAMAKKRELAVPKSAKKPDLVKLLSV